jgi:4-carboxymuconolactone decarboxylase
VFETTLYTLRNLIERLRSISKRGDQKDETSQTTDRAIDRGGMDRGATQIAAILLSRRKTYNVLGTMAQHWDAAQKFLVWAYHVMGETSTLPPRERELLILRIGWLCQSEYEWGQHVLFARAAGLSDTEIVRIKEGADAVGWAPFDANLLRAVDELHKDAFISDRTWKALSERYNTKQLMDVVFAVGQYRLVSMSLNTFGVQLDKGVKGF